VREACNIDPYIQAGDHAVWQGTRRTIRMGRLAHEGGRRVFTSVDLPGMLGKAVSDLHAENSWTLKTFITD